MKKILTILFILSLSSCYITEPRYIELNQRRSYHWDPIYYGPQFIDPLYFNRRYYQRPPVIIYRDRVVPQKPKVREPRRNAFGPTAPPSAPRQSPRSAPIREFPKKDK
jgi:hypothetical protein